MTSNLHIDKELIGEVMRLGGYKTKQAAIRAAVKAYLHHLQESGKRRQFRAIGDDPK